MTRGSRCFVLLVLLVLTATLLSPLAHAATTTEHTSSEESDEGPAASGLGDEQHGGAVDVTDSTPGVGGGADKASLMFLDSNLEHVAAMLEDQVLQGGDAASVAAVLQSLKDAIADLDDVADVQVEFTLDGPVGGDDDDAVTAAAAKAAARAAAKAVSAAAAAAAGEQARDDPGQPLRATARLMTELAEAATQDALDEAAGKRRDPSAAVAATAAAVQKARNAKRGSTFLSASKERRVRARYPPRTRGSSGSSSRDSRVTGTQATGAPLPTMVPHRILPARPDYTPAATGAYHAGRRLRDRGRWDDAVRAFERAVAQPNGHADASYELGMALARGRGPYGRDWPRAVIQWELAAEAGHAGAHRALGLAWATGRMPGSQWGHVRIPRALLHLSLAAGGGGDVRAQMVMGFLYLRGHHVTANCGRARALYAAAAEGVMRDLEEKEIAFGASFRRLRAEWDTAHGGGGASEEHEDNLVQLYQYSADHGDAGAQAALGNIFLQGAQGARQDFALALHYLGLAAAQGHAAGRALLGFMHLKGYGTLVDVKRARSLLEASAEAGDGLALVQLGKMHLHGIGMATNVTGAVKLFRAAAKRGHAVGHVRLGELHLKGMGVTRDRALAKKYFTSAAQRGNVFGLYRLASMNVGDPNVPCSQTVGIFKKVAEQGRVGLDLELAYDWWSSEDEEQRAWALQLYEELAWMGMEPAQANAAFILDYAHVAPEWSPWGANATAREERALTMYRWSAEGGSPMAHLRLGDMHYYGQGMHKPQLALAAAAYKRASLAQVGEAHFNLGYMHEHGIGLPQDYHLAKRYYDQAAEVSDASYWPSTLAVLNLGLKAMFDASYTGPAMHPVALPASGASAAATATAAAATAAAQLWYGWPLDTWALVACGTALVVLVMLRYRMIRVAA